MDVLTFLLTMKRRISSLIAMLSAAVQAKGDSKEVSRALRESQASEVASMTLTNLHHTNKQIFRSEAEHFIECIRLGC